MSIKHELMTRGMHVNGKRLYVGGGCRSSNRKMAYTRCGDVVLYCCHRDHFSAGR